MQEVSGSIPLGSTISFLRITATPALPAPFRFEDFPLTSTISLIANTSNQRAQCSDHCRADGYIALRAAPDSVVASGDSHNRFANHVSKTGISIGPP
jgi:hypothetical protein